MAAIHIRAVARNDLLEHFDYLEDHAGLNVAERFLAQAQATFLDLARQPGIGALLGLTNPALAGMRKWRIRDFDNHLVFYMAREDGVSIVRVLHRAMDWWRLLGFVA